MLLFEKRWQPAAFGCLRVMLPSVFFAMLGALATVSAIPFNAMASLKRSVPS